MSFVNTLVARAIPFVPRRVIQKVSRRYIAGDTLSEALARVQYLNDRGFSVTLDVLGETIATSQETDATANDYIELLESIQAHSLNANISIKPSALGLLLDVQHCEQLTQRILECAQGLGNSVCMDMEDVSCTDKEIELFMRLRGDHSNIGLALQAYLTRTYEDIETLASGPGVVRICKGIYAEDKQYLVHDAWRDRTAINQHFLHHVAHCFDSGMFVGVATHDAELIGKVVALARDRRIDSARFEFQMLLGVCEPLRDKVLELGFRVRVYVPFGKDWYGYSTRRLNESPSIAGHVAKALVGF